MTTKMMRGYTLPIDHDEIKHDEKRRCCTATADGRMPLRSGQTELARKGERARLSWLVRAPNRYSALVRDPKLGFTARAHSTVVHYAIASIRVRVLPNSAHTHTIPEAFTNNIHPRILYSNHLVTVFEKKVLFCFYVKNKKIQNV